MTDRVVYGQPGEDIVVQAPKDHTLSWVSEDAAHSRVRFRPVAVPTPDPVPPVEGEWFEYQGPWPTGAARYSDTTKSLAAAIAALPIGGTLILDYDGVRREDIKVTVRTGVRVLSAPGRRPWVQGDVRIQGDGWWVAGLSVEYPDSPASDHVVDTSSGLGWRFSHAEVRNAHCYTLIHPTGTIRDWRYDHLWVHDNYGSTSHTDVQDHGFYVSAPVANQNGRIDHCLIENMTRGRDIKVGSAGGGPTIGGITIDHCTMRVGLGPSNLQFSNGAGDNTVDSCVFIDSGASTAITEGSGAHTGNVYRNCWADRKVGPASANVKDGGGNTVKSASLLDYAANGAAGKGHLAP